MRSPTGCSTRRTASVTAPSPSTISSSIRAISVRSRSAEKLGKEKFYQYIRKFGFGDKTGIDLPGEVSGLLRPVEKWTRVDAATIAFGQGISVTAIQLITALSSVANQGVLMKPFIVRGLMDRKGNLVQTYHPTVVRRVISAETAKRLTAILTDVVGMEDGTGKHARIVNVAVAGKTGTSQKFDFARRVYSTERVKTSFMGFFPAEDPQIAILVILDEPQRDRWGGVAAAPVFKNIGEQLLTCFKTNIRENPAPEEEKARQRRHEGEAHFRPGAAHGPDGHGNGRYGRAELPGDDDPRGPEEIERERNRGPCHRKRLGDRPAAGGRDARAGGPPLHRHLRHGFLKVSRCDFRC